MVRLRTGDGARVLARVLITATTMVLAVLVTLLDVAPSHEALHAEAMSLSSRIGLHDAVIMSSTASDAPFVACANWAELACKDAAADRRELAPGQNTRTAFGWADADGFLVAQGCTMQISSDRRGQLIRGPRWFKVVGFLGLTQELTYTCSR